VYAYILFVSSNMISDGSELLMLIPSLAPLVGPVVLPILGAVPDGAIVIFSGLGPIAQAQSKLNVGIGALAGSTIMLLTIPWGLAIIYGRVQLLPDADGALTKGNYKPKRASNRLPAGTPNQLFGSGVNCGTVLQKNTLIMLITGGGYLIVQGSAFYAQCWEKDDNGKCSAGQDSGDITGTGHKEKLFAYIALGYCVMGLIVYLVYAICKEDDEVAQSVYAKTLTKLIKDNNLTVAVAFDFILSEKRAKALQGNVNVEGTALKMDSTSLTPDEKKLVKKVLKPLFVEFDTSGDGQLDVGEIQSLITNNFHSPMSREDATALYDTMNTDHKGLVSFDEFITGFMNYFIMHGQKADVLRQEELALEQQRQLQMQMQMQMQAEVTAEGKDAEGQEDAMEDEMEEEDEMPEDFKHLDKDEQQWAIIKRSCMLMAAGTFIVLLFSDPMVNVLNNLGTRTGIPPFFVAFILAPLASNASELIASINYASKKTVVSINVSFSQLLGAAILNNTFCTAIFLALIAFRPLVWEFTAEVFSIIFIQLVMGYMACKTTQTLFHAILIMSLFPFSIFFVWLLEYPIGLN